MDIKKCTICLESKEISEFYQTELKGRFKIKSACKICSCKKEREKYFEENKEFILNKKIFNKEEYAKEYYKKNKEILAKKNKVYIQNNKEKVSIRAKEYYQKNKEKILKKVKENREKINKYIRERRKNNLNAKISHNMRVRIREVLKENIKTARTAELLGCSLDDFKNYLEIKFRDGMNWANYGKFWHIDHIKPCSSFDLSVEEEQKKCFHYTNLQPLLAEENFRKSDNIEKTT